MTLLEQLLPSSHSHARFHDPPAIWPMALETPPPHSNWLSRPNPLLSVYMRMILDHNPLHLQWIENLTIPENMIHTCPVGLCVDSSSTEELMGYGPNYPRVNLQRRPLTTNENRGFLKSHGLMVFHVTRHGSVKREPSCSDNAMPTNKPRTRQRRRLC